MTEFVSPALLERAREADPAVTEVTDDEGRRGLVDREPGSPGTFRVALLDAEGRETGAQAWEISAVPERPAIYPSDFPFVPDLECTIGVRRPGTGTMIWMPSGCPVVPDESRSVLAENEPFRNVARKLEEARRGEGGRSGRQELQRVLEEASRDSRIQEVIARASAPPDPDTLRAFSEAFDTLIRESRKDGWVEVEASGEGSFVPRRSLSLEKDGRLRRITLVALMGQIQLTLLQR